MCVSLQHFAGVSVRSNVYMHEYQQVQLSEKELNKRLWAVLNKLVLNSLVYRQFMICMLVLIKMYAFNVQHVE